MMIVTEGQSQGRRNLVEDDVLRHEKKRAFFLATWSEHIVISSPLFSVTYPGNPCAIYKASYPLCELCALNNLRNLEVR